MTRSMSSLRKAGLVLVAVIASRANAQLQPAARARVIAYDEGHNNFPHTRVHGMLDIARQLGFSVQPFVGTLDTQLATRPDLLIICVPASVPDSVFVAMFREPRGTRAPDWPYWAPEFDRSAYSENELHALVEWIRGGGRFLLLLDHAPVPFHARTLARAVGVEVRDAFTTDPSHYPPGYASRPDSVMHAYPTQQHWILFSRATGTIGSHPITDGADLAHRVEAVATYTGSSLQGPVGSTSLLSLSDQSVDIFRPWSDGPEYRMAASGRSQAIAFLLGKGRVVVTSETGYLQASPFGSEPPNSGLDYAHANNRIFAENVFRWLTDGQR